MRIINSIITPESEVFFNYSKPDRDGYAQLYACESHPIQSGHDRDYLDTYFSERIAERFEGNKAPRVVGFTEWYLHPHHGEPTAHTDILRVHPYARGGQVGETMLKVFSSICVESGIHKNMTQMTSLRVYALRRRVFGKPVSMKWVIGQDGYRHLTDEQKKLAEMEPTEELLPRMLKREAEDPKDKYGYLSYDVGLDCEFRLKKFYNDVWKDVLWRQKQAKRVLPNFFKSMETIT